MTGGKQISQCCMSVIHNAMLICDHWRAKGAITQSGGQSIDSQKANTAWKEAGKQCSLHPTRKLQGTEEALSVLCPLCQYSVALCQYSVPSTPFGKFSVCFTTHAQDWVLTKPQVFVASCSFLQRRSGGHPTLIIRGSALAWVPSPACSHSPTWKP